MVTDTPALPRLPEGNQQRLEWLIPAFYVTAGLLAIVVIGASQDSAAAMKHAMELNELWTKAGHLGDAFLEGVTLGQYDAASRREAEYVETVNRALQSEAAASFFAWILAGVTAVFVWRVFSIGRASSGNGRRSATRHLCYTSLILFFVGIGATALGMIAAKEVPVLGMVVLKFEAKGIASTIAKLFTSGNAFLGLLIFLFSIAIPLAKVGLMLYATYTTGEPHVKAMKVIKAVGKWSMADVFVVALLLAVFAIGGSDKSTDAFTGPGLYFFAAYCILSMWAGVWLAHEAADMPASSGHHVSDVIAVWPSPRSSAMPALPTPRLAGIAVSRGNTAKRNGAELEWRQWTSADTGKSQEAAYEDCRDGVVYVVRRDGSTGKIVMTKLSDGDRQYVDRQLRRGQQGLFEIVD